MFSTLLGPLPADPDPAATTDARIRDTLVDLEKAGVELLADGEPLDLTDPPEPASVVGRWRAAAAVTTRTVKAVLPGPYSAGRAGVQSAAAWADALRPSIDALADAGCPLIEIDEFDALAITLVSGERRRFIDAHRRLVGGVDGVHLSLTLTGGNLDEAGAATFFDLPYASYAFDLIAGPDNWRLIAAAPTDRGIVCGALSPLPGADLARDILVWAAHYAASTNGRGRDRVGLANSSSLAGLPRNEALRRLSIVADAARMAAVESPEDLAPMLDPRAVGLPAPRRRR
jgi:methionine synthase II (cobalamin-independent)